MNRLISEIYSFVQMMCSVIPGTPGHLLRSIMYKSYLAKQGKNFYTANRVTIQTPDNIYIGENVGINYGVWVAANKDIDGRIIIKDNVLIGPYSILHSGNHIYENAEIPINKQGFAFKPIVVEEDVWIAARCTILAGVTIGTGAVIGAGTVVTKNVPPYAVVVGVPGKVVGYRNEKKKV